MPISERDLHELQLSMAALTWFLRPDRIRKLPEEEQAAWLSAIMRGAPWPPVSRETE